MKQALIILALTASACSLEANDSPPDEAATDDSNIESDAATLKLTDSFESILTGQPKAGRSLRVEYALGRLPQCRGDLPGGTPGWNVTGYYSENGGPAKSFDVTQVSPDGKSRIAKPARITPTAGGDLALWFQVTNRWGCSAFDSAHGKNFHVAVAGTAPDPALMASITFLKDGSMRTENTLRSGGKVKIRYEQDRLPGCRRIEQGSPNWGIAGFASLPSGETKRFETTRIEGSGRQDIDVVLDLPTAGELALWFQVSSRGGCVAYDSKNGQNYRFAVE